MSWPRAVASRIRGLWTRGRAEHDLESEIRFHLEMQAEDNRRAGMNAEEARYAAQRSFGGVESMKDQFRDRRSLQWIETLLRDLSHGARILARRPGFTVAAGLSLALGIGVTTTIFSALNAVTLRPLPYADADRLIWMTQILKKNSTDELTLTEHFLEWRTQNKSFVDLAGYNGQTRSLTGIEEPIEIPTAKVSASFLPLLGVQPVIGRNFLKQEDYKGRDQVAVLTNGLWRDRFGANPDIVGQSVLLDGTPFTVVGVLPRDFAFPGPDPVQLLTPLGKDEAAELQHKVGSVIRNIIGKVKPGVSLEQARAELTVIQSRLPLPPFQPAISLKMLPLREYLFGDVKTAGVVLFAAAAFLLLIACANVSNLLLTQWMQRDRELAVRSALGGSRGRLISQLVTESALLGILACAAGVIIAFWARRPLIALSPYHLAGIRNLPLDWHVLGFAGTLGLTTVLLFGILPALHATRISLTRAIKAGEAAVVGGRGSLRVLSIIAASEIAITLVLSTGAGLMLESFWRMRYKNLGFRSDHLVAATLNLYGPAYRDPARRAAFVQDLLERAQALPGVELAGLASARDIPPGIFHATNTFFIEGRDQPLGGPRPIGRYPVVSSGYFGIMGIPLLQGRLLRDADGEGAPPVVVVNQSLVHRYFEHENPLGKRIGCCQTDTWRTIVGVVGDMKTSGLAASPEPAIYLPFRQLGPLPDIGVVLRSQLSAGTIAGEFRRAVTALDSHQPVASVQSMDDRLSESVSGPRFTALLLFAFAGLAVVLGLIGVYGVMGCRVRSQLRELAVRQALGARKQDVVLQVFRQGIGIIFPGLAIGLLGAVALSRLISGMLYQVSAHDPLTFAIAAASLMTVALLACWFPAVRAAQSDPLQLLRQD